MLREDFSCCEDFFPLSVTIAGHATSNLGSVEMYPDSPEVPVAFKLRISSLGDEKGIRKVSVRFFWYLLSDTRCSKDRKGPLCNRLQLVQMCRSICNSTSDTTRQIFIYILKVNPKQPHFQLTKEFFLYLDISKLSQIMLLKASVLGVVHQLPSSSWSWLQSFAHRQSCGCSRGSSLARQPCARCPLPSHQVINTVFGFFGKTDVDLSRYFLYDTVLKHFGTDGKAMVKDFIPLHASLTELTPKLQVPEFFTWFS